MYKYLQNWVFFGKNGFGSLSKCVVLKQSNAEEEELKKTPKGIFYCVRFSKIIVQIHKGTVKLLGVLWNRCV